MFIETKDIPQYLTIQDVRDCFEAVGPDLIWKVRPHHHFPKESSMRFFNNKWPGKVAGTSGSKGKVTVSFLSEYKFSMADLAWIIHYNQYPDRTVYPLNGNKQDFSKENLAQVAKAKSLH